MLPSAFPGFKMHVGVEHLVAEGEYVVGRIMFRLTNAGKEAAASTVTEYHVVNGRIEEDWPPSDAAVLLQQIGLALPSA